MAKGTTTQRADRRLRSVNEAAEIAGVTPRTVRRWIATGQLPGYRMGPRLLKVDLDELDRFARRVPAGPAA